MRGQVYECRTWRFQEEQLFGIEFRSQGHKRNAVARRGQFSRQRLTVEKGEEEIKRALDSRADWNDRADQEPFKVPAERFQRSQTNLQKSSRAGLPCFYELRRAGKNHHLRVSRWRV